MSSSLVPHVDTGSVVPHGDTGSVHPLNRFDAEKKRRFLELAPTYWPNIGALADAVGITRVTVWNHRKSDPAFNRALMEIDARVCDDLEQTLHQQGLQPKGFLDRISYLRAHRPELYDRAKVVKIEGYKMDAQEKAKRIGRLDNVIDAEIVKSYTTRKERKRMKLSGGSGEPKPRGT